MSWTVTLKRSVVKAVVKEELPENVRAQLAALIKAIEIGGPFRTEWTNFGKLSPKEKGLFHCHLKSGRPTYVVCWQVTDNRNKKVEVYYAGTHEKAPY